jgi:clan AA aspartic protease (TIGR02281 family)
MKTRRIAGMLVALAMTVLAAPAFAELYQWTDGDGVRHYTSDLASIPEPYRPGARDIGSPRAREAPAAETRREGDASVLRFRGGAPVVVPVTINGVGLRLMIDTGADRTLLSPAAAARTGLPLETGRQVKIVGVAGSAMASELTVVQLEVAGARVGPVRVVVLETPTANLDGLLGRDVLDSFTLTIDGGAGRATLVPR